MTRKQKIEALALEKYPVKRKTWFGNNLVGIAEDCDSDLRASFKAGILAGLKLALEEIGEFDEDRASTKAIELSSGMVAFMKGARWQHEQFIKAIKADG